MENHPGGYVVRGDTNKAWDDIRQFVENHHQYFVHPIRSRLHDECVEEIEVRQHAKGQRIYVSQNVLPEGK